MRSELAKSAAVMALVALPIWIAVPGEVRAQEQTAQKARITTPSPNRTVRKRVLVAPRMVLAGSRTYHLAMIHGVGF
jgi:hypothetical protein